jgi:23S rRNA (adenine2503-C2)-methyltransferase
VVEARRLLVSQGSKVRINNVVFMGMGEPLHNYDAVMAAVEILTGGLGFSHNKVIVSTVGLVPQIRSFVARGGAKLAVSLHATTDEVRLVVPLTPRYQSTSQPVKLSTVCKKY